MLNRLVGFGCLVIFAGSAWAADAALKSDRDKRSYVLGVQLARDLKNQGLESVEFDDKTLILGLREQLSGKLQMSSEDMEKAFTGLREEASAKKEQRDAMLKTKNKQEGDAYLVKNKAQKGVTTLPSGLQYEILTEGKGAKPLGSDTVSVHYRGKLIDGTEFDSSYSRNQPANFRVDQVIKGWVEALQLMNVGSKWKLFIPPELGYGENGAGGVIGPNQTLLFEVELLGVVK